MSIAFKRVSRWTLSGIVCALFLGLQVRASSLDTGAIQGWVLDEEGSALPGVQVRVSSAALMNERTANSGPNGSFRFAGLPPGMYKVEASLPGFSPGVQTARVHANTTTSVSIPLRLETMATEITVTSSSGPRRPARKRARLPVVSAPAPHVHYDLEVTAPAADQLDTEAYDRIVDNPFRAAEQNPLSTFSIDVDTASYANLRRFVQGGQLPPKDAVRIEEMLNYFTYEYPQPDGEQPFSVTVEVAQAPWKLEHRLMRIGLKGKEIPVESRPASNFVFLVDVSGSMNQPNKLPLVVQSLKMLAVNLSEKDRVAMVVYAGASGLVLDSTSNKRAMLDALNRLQAGGSTNGGQGIQLAYKVARENFIEGGNNRVILCTDGDFNVGVTNHGDLTRLIEEKAKSGVFLSVLGFGMGNYKDSTLEKLADKGNGNYAYIDTLAEGRKVLVQQMGGTLYTIAKDVKLQLEFNPAKVAGYRLIGYENRLLAAQDFNDDKKDAGEIGAGHTVTALYEIVPAGRSVPGAASVDALKYQKPAEAAVGGAASEELLTVKLRYKQPTAETSQLLAVPVSDADGSYDAASADFKFAASVAAFGMLLRDSEHKGSASYEAVLELAEEGRGADKEGWRGEFLQIVKLAKGLRRN